MDGLFTLIAITHGASEFNPIMAVFLEIGVVWFLLNKLVLVNLMIWFVGARVGPSYLARWGIILIAFTYGFLLIYHLIGLYELISHA